MSLKSEGKEIVEYDERSAGGLVYKQENNKIFWLLVKTIADRKKKNGIGGDVKNSRIVYKFPKGHIQNKEFLKQTALREVEEEGQVKAKIVTKLGSNNYIIWDKLQKKRIVKKVTFFLMEFVSISNLKHFDTEMVLARDWFTFEEAKEKLAYDSEKTLLKKAKSKLEALLKTKK